MLAICAETEIKGSIPVELVQSLIVVQAVLGSTPLARIDTSWGANARHWGQNGDKDIFI